MSTEFSAPDEHQLPKGDLDNNIVAELMNKPEFLYFREDFAVNTSCDTRIAILAEPDGGRIVHLVSEAAQTHDAPPHSFGNPGNTEEFSREQHNAFSLLAYNAIEGTYYNSSSSEGQAILTALDYKIEGATDERGHGKATLRLPSTEHINQFLDAVRERTGFAPRVEDFKGGEFSNELQAAKLSEDTILVSDQLGVREHDLIIHVPAWTILPKQFLQMIIGDQAVASMLYDRVDLVTDSKFFVHASKLDNEKSRTEMKDLLAYILFDQTHPNFLKETELETINDLTDAIWSRVQAVASCAAEFNSLAKTDETI